MLVRLTLRELGCSTTNKRKEGMKKEKAKTIGRCAVPLKGDNSATQQSVASAARRLRMMLF